MNLKTAFQNPKLSLIQIINMSVGFFGIQFGWDLQRANMGRIYEGLGANPDQVPLLFLAAPLTGLLIQPIIGYLSDHTWHPKWGRRRPYFMVGAIISSIALIFMPNSGTLWMAAGLLWVLDVFGNVSMEPFRAFVTDKLPDSQVNRGFIMQSMMIGLGGSVASALPWLMKNVFHLTNTAAEGFIPENVKYSFYIGAFFFLAAVLWTVFTTKEYPPTEEELNNQKLEGKKGFLGGAKDIFKALADMPKRMQIVSLVQFFTWPGLFLMWFYYTTAVAVNVFGGTNASDPIYAAGADFGSLTLAYYSVVTFLFALVLPIIADKLGRKTTHALCLLCGAIGLISVAWVTDKNMLYLCMTGVGIAWASILSMPYAMLSGSLPKAKIGIYMGIFNFFIVLPEIMASLGFGWLMRNVLNNDRLLAVQLGGALMVLAALICFIFIKEPKTTDKIVTAELEIEEGRAI
ncbi:MFS transporter [Pedobacter sp. SD-b]|uniref:MFS transporter n=1 Tax=Pedobacter segetis TaxID=2793069 RepID=A0ABS1BN83_9SPHI|nr:MFS transporter [Pedobacter segetis]MBK0384263.1 MFS transporter [Pedobacter segetis]